MSYRITRESLDAYDKSIKKFIKEEQIRNMTSEEAARELEIHNSKLKDMIIFNQDFSSETDNYSLKKKVKANYLAIQALNKETPQKVISDYDYLGFEKCPKCKYGSLLDSKHTQFEYCPMCGQKLEWS